MFSVCFDLKFGDMWDYQTWLLVKKGLKIPSLGVYNVDFRSNTWKSKHLLVRSRKLISRTLVCVILRLINSC